MGSTQQSGELADCLQHAFARKIVFGDKWKWSLKVKSKYIRDELCLRLRNSKSKPKDVKVQAQLTQHQRLVRDYIGKEIDSEDTWQMSLAADVAEIW
jgi:hypothetical protein